MNSWLGGWLNTQFCHWETSDLRSHIISFGKAASHKLRICEVEKQIFKHLTFNLPISEAFLIFIKIIGLGFDNIQIANWSRQPEGYTENAGWLQHLKSERFARRCSFSEF